ncbi:MAG: glycosyltransferase family 4 protein [Bacteroidales bacterium]
MAITQKNILLISPISIKGGKAAFTRNLIEVYQQNCIKFYHIDLVRHRSSNYYMRVIEHFYNFFAYKIKVIKTLIIKPIDIVQIHTSSYFDFYDLSLVIIISKLFRKKVILRHGGGGFPTFYRKANWIKRKYFKWALSLPDKLIVLSDYWHAYFKDIGIKEPNIFLMPNFVDEERYSIRDKIYDKPTLNILFMPAKSLIGKGFFDFKNSIIELAFQNPNVIFHIVGPEVDKHIQGENIHTYKMIFGGKKTELFDLCQIYFLPTHAEGFPNSMIEAMAAQMAVITTNIPEIKCLVNDNYDCLLIDTASELQFKEKFLYLLNNRTKLMEIGKNARELVVKNYSLKLMSVYLKKLYA